MVALIASGSKYYESVGSGSLVGVALPSADTFTDAQARLKLVPKWEGSICSPMSSAVAVLMCSGIELRSGPPPIARAAWDLAVKACTPVIELSTTAIIPLRTGEAVNEDLISPFAGEPACSVARPTLHSSFISPSASARYRDSLFCMPSSPSKLGPPRAFTT